MATLTIADLDNGKRDLQTVEEVANSRAATAATRFGQQTTTLYEAIRHIQAKGDEVISNLGFRVPVPYASGLEITDLRFTVTGPDGKVYAPLSAPFTTGAWDSTQWYVLQNDLNDRKLLVFDTMAAAQAAAATLPDGQIIKTKDASGVDSIFNVVSGSLDFIDYEPSVISLETYDDLRGYGGDATVVDISGFGIAGRFRAAPLVSFDADNNGTIIVDGTGRRWFRLFTGHVVSSWFGTAGDKVTDDTAALQDAIDFCNSHQNAKELLIQGMCLVTSSLIIDRPVDVTTNEFFICGSGTSSGFYVETPITLFDSSLPMPTEFPPSEFVTFKDIRFEASSTAASANTVSKKFLRMKFFGCYWRAMRMMDSTGYIQSFYFHGCNIRRWSGIWLNALHAFDTHFVQCISEHGDNYLTRFVEGSHSLTFRDGVHEGAGGGLVAGGGFHQLTVDGYYMEHNQAPCVLLTQGPTNYGVSITNNILMATVENSADPEFWDIVWGPTVGANSGGNVSVSGQIHDNSYIGTMGSVLYGASTDTSIVSSRVVKTPLDADGFTSSITDLVTSTIGGGVCNYGTATRNGDNLFIDFSFTFPISTSGSPAALYLPKPCVNPNFGGLVSFTDYTDTVLVVAGGAAHPAGQGNSAAVMCSSLAGSALNYAAMSGRTVSCTINYKVQG